VDLALVKNPLERPELKQLLQSLQPGEFLLVESMLDLGRRFNDVYSILKLFRDGLVKGGFISIREEIFLESKNCPLCF
jgi:DNA invertase Pin-like site-specific DNA recombinase